MPGQPNVAQSSFVVAAHGAPATPPAADLIEHLRARGARSVTAVLHPLAAEHGRARVITSYELAREPRERILRLPAHPPFTYLLDAFIPLRLPQVDCWFAFNNLLCGRGLVERRLGRSQRVVYWPVDFVPNRFGPRRAITRGYDSLDAHCCRAVNLRLEVSQAALTARDAHHGLEPSEGAPRAIAPIGIWLDRLPSSPEDGFAARRVIFTGHLVERMGCETVIEAVDLLARRGVEVSADVTGRGPLEQALRRDVQRRGLHDRVRFHGFLPDHREVEHLLAQASVALAPYNTRIDSFTRYADPAKLKSYLAAGLPVLLTDVPPNARQLAASAGAEIVADDPRAFADAIERTLCDPEGWRARRAAALGYARQFDWGVILDNVLEAAGFAFSR